MAASSLVAESDLADLRREGMAPKRIDRGRRATQAAVETAPMDRQCQPIRRVLWLRPSSQPKARRSNCVTRRCSTRRLHVLAEDDGPEPSASGESPRRAILKLLVSPGRLEAIVRPLLGPAVHVDDARGQRAARSLGGTGRRLQRLITTTLSSGSRLLR